MTTNPNEALHAKLREAGGIVHRDGNIFFTNAEQFLKAARTSATSDAAGWQPIETAPKDGTPVLLWSDKRRGSWMAKWVPVYASGYSPDNKWFNLMLNCHWHPNQYEVLVPTHWMPLPPPPVSAGGGQ